MGVTCIDSKRDLTDSLVPMQASLSLVRAPLVLRESLRTRLGFSLTENRQLRSQLEGGRLHGVRSLQSAFILSLSLHLLVLTVCTCNCFRQTYMYYTDPTCTCTCTVHVINCRCAPSILTYLGMSIDQSS